MKPLHNLYIRFFVWLGAAPSIGYEHLYPGSFISNQEYMLMLTWPMAISVAISTIFFVRCIRGNIRNFSGFGHFALAWPLIEFLPAAINGFFGFVCLPVQLGLALMVIAKEIEEQKHSGDLIILPACIIWTLLSNWYNLRWWSLIGD